VDNYFELSFGRIHIWEVSLRGRRETSGKRLGTNKKTKQGLKAWIPAGVYPREGGDGNDREERLWEKTPLRTKRDFGSRERI